MFEHITMCQQDSEKAAGKMVENLHLTQQALGEHKRCVQGDQVQFLETVETAFSQEKKGLIEYQRESRSTMQDQINKTRESLDSKQNFIMGKLRLEKEEQIERAKQMERERNEIDDKLTKSKKEIDEVKNELLQKEKLYEKGQKKLNERSKDNERRIKDQEKAGSSSFRFGTKEAGSLNDADLVQLAIKIQNMMELQDKSSSSKDIPKKKGRTIKELTKEDVEN